MARLTITLPDPLHRALKEAAARRGTTLGELICESLEQYGIKPADRAAEMVTRARRRSGLDEGAAVELAVGETRDHRRR